MNTSIHALPKCILGRPSLGEFVAFIKSFVRLFPKADPDVSRFVGGLARAKFPELMREGLLPASDVDSLADAEREISVCYSRLRALAASENHGEYARTLARLRTLQESEARRLSSAFRAGRWIEPVAVEKALQRADELLIAHENPADED